MSAPSVGDNEFWIEWHAQYDDPASPRSRRLRAVQRQLNAALDVAPAGPIALISMCAGQGRDVLPVLADHRRGRDVRALLVEKSPELVGDARAAVVRGGLEGVEIVEGDASLTSVYAGAVPADVVLACGVFGSITEDEIETTIGELPHLCATGATAIWTKEGNQPDLRSWVRDAFTAVGFEEVAYDTEEGTVFGVGSARWNAPPLPFRAGRQMFAFRPRGTGS